MALEWLEQIDRSGSACNGGFSVDGGRFVRPYIVMAPQPSDLVNAIVDILGTTAYASSGNGKLNRTPPVADPVYPWLYAFSIQAIVGKGGQFVVTDPAYDNLQIQAIAQFALFPAYVFMIEFRPRPYAILLDEDITQYTAGSTYASVYYPTLDNGTSTFCFAQGNSTYALSSPQTNWFFVDEWNRYTDFDLQSTENYVSSQVGSGKFVTSGIMARQGLPDANNAQPMIAPRIFLPDEVLELIWYQVPLRLITSPASYLRRWRGRVNQNALSWPSGVYTPGSVLYVNFKQKKYQPPVPNQVQNQFGDPTTFSTEKLCDITMRFLLTNRYVPDIPATAPANRNCVLGAVDPNTGLWNGGHNALPWLTDRQFHFSVGNVAAGSSTMSYVPFQSAPLELLFTDCDSNPSQSGLIVNGGIGP